MSLHLGCCWQHMDSTYGFTEMPNHFSSFAFCDVSIQFFNLVLRRHADRISKLFSKLFSASLEKFSILFIWDFFSVLLVLRRRMHNKKLGLPGEFAFCASKAKVQQVRRSLSRLRSWWNLFDGFIYLRSIDVAPSTEAWENVALLNGDAYWMFDVYRSRLCSD